MAGGHQQQSETPLQKQQIASAQAAWQDYLTHYAPLQRAFVTRTEANEPALQARMLGEQNEGNVAQFQKAQDAALTSSANRGAILGSGAQIAGLAGLQNAQDASRGLGQTQTADKMQNQYMTTLMGQLGMGNGMQSNANTSLAGIAQDQARQAQQAAQIKAQQQTQIGQAVGQLAGLGLGYGANKLGSLGASPSAGSTLGFSLDNDNLTPLQPTQSGLTSGFNFGPSYNLSEFAP